MHQLRHELSVPVFHQVLFLHWGLVGHPVDRSRVIRFAVVVDEDFFTIFDGFDGGVDHGFGFEVLFPVGIGFERVVVDTAKTKNNCAVFGRTPWVHVPTENGFFEVLSFFGSDSDCGSGFDNVAGLEVFCSKNTTTFVAGVFDFDAFALTFHEV